MYRGQTPKNRAGQEKQNTEWIKNSFGKDFVAKLKSSHRHEFNGAWKKEQGQGDASLRRYRKARSEGLQSRIK